MLGISSGRCSSQAVATGYAGDLVIPSHIDGLPVRKINEAAFLACTKLTSVTIPSTVREVGARAFSMCLSLTNVYFEGSAPRLIGVAESDKSVQARQSSRRQAISRAVVFISTRTHTDGLRPT